MTGWTYWLLIASSWNWCGSTCDVTDLLNKGGRVDILDERDDVQSENKDTFVWIKDAPAPSPPLPPSSFSSFRSPSTFFSIWLRGPADKARRKRIKKEGLLLFLLLLLVGGVWVEEQSGRDSFGLFFLFFGGGLCRCLCLYLFNLSLVCGCFVCFCQPGFGRLGRCFGAVMATDSLFKVSQKHSALACVCVPV